MEEIKKFLGADEWQGISVVFEFLIVVGGSIWAAVKYRLIAGIKQHWKIIGLVILYFISGYLISYSVHTFWIVWWFVFMIIVYVVNQLISYPELFKKGFQDNFKHGLHYWEYYGDWRIVKEPDDYILQVSNSDAGGISVQCKTWTNYNFSFDTKIVKHNTSWIIRATDVFSYVMLQCKIDEIRTHCRIQGNWVVPETLVLPFKISLNEWFYVKIEVRNIRVIVKILYQDKIHTVLDRDLLQPQVIPVIPVIDKENSDIGKVNWACSYPHGSVGFRQYGDETAYFKNVKVLKIQ